MTAQTRNYAFLFVGWITLFLCQRTVPCTISHLQTSANFSMENIGTLMSCFELTYALTKLASGLLYDNLQLNPKLFFCSGLAVGGLLCLCFPMTVATSVSLMCAVDGGRGIPRIWVASMCTYAEPLVPTIRHWCEVHYTFCWIKLNWCCRPNTLCLPGYYAIGWQYVYYILGSSCLLMTSILAVGMEYLPREKKEPNQKTNSMSNSPSFSWHSVFLFKEFWLVTTLNVINWVAKASIADWIQPYLTKQMNWPSATAAI